jgi:hypothetical protein
MIKKFENFEKDSSQFEIVSRRLSQDERVELEKKIEDLVSELDLDFDDNYRLVIDESLDRESYQIAQSTGCCGSIDDHEIVLSTGTKVLFGCNYGH